MTPSSLKRFLVGAAVVASSIPGIALADPTCAYIIGHVDGKTVTTPAQTVVVPDSDALAEPIFVHLDETSQNVIGYTIALPGSNAGTYGSPVFIPGFFQQVPSFSFTVPSLPLNISRCIDYTGASVPAIPFRIPASAFTVPGAVANVGGAIFNVAGNPFTAPGAIITYDGKQIFVPEMSGAIPGGAVATPNKSITLDINGTLESAKYLPPHK